MDPKPKAYSLIRFLRTEQIPSDSRQRLLEKSRHYAEAKGLDLDESLTIEDAVLSACSDEQKAQGALGAFLEAVKKGKVPADSLLMIESLDMFSREEIITALSLFTSIIDKGVSIVTLEDGAEYNPDTVNTNILNVSRKIIGMLW